MKDLNRLLKIKPWQLFIYLVIVPLFFPDDDTHAIYIIVFGLFLVVWILKIDEELYYRLPKKPKVNLTILQINLIITFVYLAIIFLFTNGYSISSEKDNYAEYGWKMWIYVPFTFYIFFSYFYALHFVAYSINILEKRLFNKTTEYTALLLAFFFFPIGLWWLQPKINRILNTPEFDNEENLNEIESD